MANQTCTQRLRICHLRIIRLAPNGEPLEGADSLYESPAPVLMNFTPNVRDRDEFEMISGCGTTCGSFVSAPTGVENANITLEICNSDAEVMELLAGGDLIIDYDTGDTIGYCAPTDETVNSDGVAIEVWAYQWDGNERAIFNGEPGWYRFVFPKTTWTFAEQGFENEFSTVALEGFAEANSGYGTGLESDPFPAPVSSVWCWAITDSIPDAECGVQAVPVAA